jgi:tetratricopeptide (TPR) repeat protein
MPMAIPKTGAKVGLCAALVIVLCGWAAPAAAQFSWPAQASPAVQMVLDRVQQRYLAKSGANLRQVELQSPRAVAVMVGLVIREQSFHAQRNPALQAQLQQLTSECLDYLNRVGANVGYRERWNQETGSWADLQSKFHAAVAGQMDEYAQRELGATPEPGPSILQSVRVDPNRPLRQQPPDIAGAPPAQPPAGPAGRPLVPMQDPRSITLLGQPADPREQAPPAAPGGAGGTTDAQRLANAADWTYRGTIAMREKRYQEALVNYSEAIRLAPENGYYWYNRALLYRDRKEYQSALADISRAISAQSDRYAYWCTRAGIHWLVGSKALALQDYDQCCRISRAESIRLNAPGIITGCRTAEDMRAGRM